MDAEGRAPKVGALGDAGNSCRDTKKKSNKETSNVIKLSASYLKNWSAIASAIAYKNS
ncbi:hypothetical protein [Methylobacter psychrophilus]|jgi:hypothetical protein|uniref:hypothetical protein n=1 Tax=Methylobacter psychrophilus TaxID=96941 RepID=UPI0021D4BFE2|nr:hypothetical protein [Methylobacter psychrophilus]